MNKLSIFKLWSIVKVVLFQYKKFQFRMIRLIDKSNTGISWIEDVINIHVIALSLSWFDAYSRVSAVYNE